MDTLDDYWSEISVSVWTEHHLLLKLDGTPQDGTAQNETDTSAEETRVNNKLGSHLSLHWYFRSLLHKWLGILVLLRQYAKEISEHVSTSGFQVGNRKDWANLTTLDVVLYVVDIINGLDQKRRLLAIHSHDL